MLCQHSHLCTYQGNQVLDQYIVQKFFFHKTNKQVSIVGAHFSSRVLSDLMHIVLVLNKEKYARSYKSIVVQVHVTCLNYNIQNL